MELVRTYIEGQTPLDEDEREGLYDKTIESQSELDEREQGNIINAREWVIDISPNLDEILSEDFIKRVHKKMFGDVWKWAGKYRSANKNLGADKFEISIELRKVFDDCKFWIENKSFSEDEIAVRFKHRVVVVHPFANGNGRHSRLIGDIMISKYFKLTAFSWSSKGLIAADEARKQYLSALRKADNGSYDELVKFARS